MISSLHEFGLLGFHSSIYAKFLLCRCFDGLYGLGNGILHLYHFLHWRVVCGVAELQSLPWCWLCWHAVLHHVYQLCCLLHVGGEIPAWKCYMSFVKLAYTPAFVFMCLYNCILYHNPHPIVFFSLCNQFHLRYSFPVFIYWYFTNIVSLCYLLQQGQL